MRLGTGNEIVLAQPDGHARPHRVSRARRSNSVIFGIALYVSAASAATWQINVSNATAGLVFNPNNITAAVGDTVEFIFNPKNHSVTQSSFAQPCTPLSGGFDTGFLPVTNGTDNSSLPTRQFVVNDVSLFSLQSAGHMGGTGSSCSDHTPSFFPFRLNPFGFIVASLQTPRGATAARAWCSQSIPVPMAATIPSLISKQLRWPLALNWPRTPQTRRPRLALALARRRNRPAGLEAPARTEQSSQ